MSALSVSSFSPPLLCPGAFGTLGVGGGFALGAKLCRPDSEVRAVFSVSNVELFVTDACVTESRLQCEIPVSPS